jgi:acetyltransferase-like isoleucine patch superfamily enzyme
MRPRLHLEADWFARGIPANVRLGDDVYLDSSYGFDGVLESADGGVSIGGASGAYDRAAFLVGLRGKVEIGEFTVLNGSYIICERRISIGSHCLLAWGAVITDVWGGECSTEARREMLRAGAHDADRWPGAGADPRPVSIADNVWIGFDAVVMPGTVIGRGAVVSSRSVVSGDIPPYAVVVGNPGRVIRTLTPDDTSTARDAAFQEYLKRDHA